MLKSSQCSVVFPTNGVALTSNITFQPGITAVIGRNGTGKTFKTIELCRYLLFGKKALRGPASDYKRLEAEGVFEIKGAEYRIRRTPKEEFITPVDGEVLAVGAEAVNKKVIELLGFGLDVFDICNASVQKQSSKLTQLTPAKRKELIDEVCGLAQNERAEKDCRDKAKLLKLEAVTIADNMIPPQEPIVPEGYRPSREIEAELKTAREVEAERVQLQRVCDRTFPLVTEPSQPKPDLIELEAHEKQRDRNETERRQLAAIIEAIPTTNYTAEEIKVAQAWVQYDVEVARRGPKPELAADAAQMGVDAWYHINALKEINVDMQCPHCNKIFTPAMDLPPEPNQPSSYFEEQVRRCNQWLIPLQEPTGKRIPHDELQRAHAAITRRAERESMVAALAEIEQLADRSVELATARTLLSEWERYEASRKALKDALEEQMQAQERLAELPAPVDIAALDAAFVASRVYEDQEVRFERDSAAYLEKMAKSRDLNKKSSEYKEGAHRLVEARKEVKAYLAPAFSRIASMLISEMTCGKLNTVLVDDDMNVTVDGQDVATLSGAGETAANLALRLALGRTLVGGVFPVFLADEIDGDADEERSEATFECLRNLKGQFAQVIMISHKPHLTADHVIDFDE